MCCLVLHNTTKKICKTFLVEARVAGPFERSVDESDKLKKRNERRKFGYWINTWTTRARHIWVFLRNGTFHLRGKKTNPQLNSWAAWTHHVEYENFKTTLSLVIFLRQCEQSSLFCQRTIEDYSLPSLPCEENLNGKVSSTVTRSSKY